VAEHDQGAKSSELSVTNLTIAGFAAVAATLVLSRFGLAGTLTGAGLTPIVVAVTKEMARRPVDTVARLAESGRGIVRPAGAPQVPSPAPTGPPRLASDSRAPRRRRWAGVRWSRVFVTAAAAFVIAVAVFTLPDLIAGRSIVSDRTSTFFSTEPAAPAAPEPETPATPTTTAPTETAPDTTTAPTAPVETAPELTIPEVPTAPTPTAPVPPAPVSPLPAPVTPPPAP
jgi:hypothetical protein